MKAKTLAVVCAIGEMKKQAAATTALQTTPESAWPGFLSLVSGSKASVAPSAAAAVTGAAGEGGTASIVQKLSQISPWFASMIKSHPKSSAAIGGALGALILRRLFD